MWRGTAGAGFSPDLGVFRVVGSRNGWRRSSRGSDRAERRMHPSDRARRWARGEAAAITVWSERRERVVRTWPPGWVAA